MALLLAATLTSCGEKEPSAVEKDLAEKCGGRITAGSLGFRFDEGGEDQGHRFLAQEWERPVLDHRQ